MPRPLAASSPSWKTVQQDAKLAIAFLDSNPELGPELMAARAASSTLAVATTILARVTRKAQRAKALGTWSRDLDEITTSVVRRTIEEITAGSLPIAPLGVALDRHLTLCAFKLLDGLRPALLRRAAGCSVEDFAAITRRGLPRLDEDACRRFRRRAACALTPYPALLVCVLTRLDFEFVGSYFGTPAASLRHAFHHPSDVVLAALGGTPGAPYRQLRRRGAVLFNLPTRDELSQVGCDDISEALFRDPTVPVTRSGSPTRTAVLQAVVDRSETLTLAALGDRRLCDRMVHEAKNRLVQVALEIGRLRAA